MLKILHVFRSGFVGRKEREHQKDSPDFVFHGMIDNVHTIFIIEIKARCSSSTAAKERRKITWCEITFTYHVTRMTFASTY